MQSGKFLIPPSPGSLVSVEEVVTRARSSRHGHRHGRAHVCVLLDGSFEEQDATGQIRHCEVGTVRISPPGHKHRIHFGAEGARCLLFLMPGPAARTASWFPSCGASNLFRTQPKIAALAKRARTEACSGEPDAPLVIEELLAEILARAKAPERHTSPPGWLTRVRCRIDNGFREPIRLTRIAEEAGVHRVHLSRAFLRHYGRSAREHLRGLRLAEAARLLASSDRSIGQVAIESGFFDQSHLTTAFTERFGRPPGAFRRERS